MEKENEQNKHHVVVVKTDRTEDVQYMAVPLKDNPEIKEIIEAYAKKGKTVDLVSAKDSPEFASHLLVEVQFSGKSMELRRAMHEMIHAYYFAIEKGCDPKVLDKMLKGFIKDVLANRSDNDQE